jgi:hypothetical protein
VTAGRRGHAAFLGACLHLPVVFGTNPFAFLPRLRGVHAVAVFVAFLIRHHLVAVNVPVADLFSHSILIRRLRPILIPQALLIAIPILREHGAGTDNRAYDGDGK